MDDDKLTEQSDPQLIHLLGQSIIAKRQERRERMRDRARALQHSIECTKERLADGTQELVELLCKAGFRGAKVEELSKLCADRDKDEDELERIEEELTAEVVRLW